MWFERLNPVIKQLLREPRVDHMLWRVCFQRCFPYECGNFSGNFASLDPCRKIHGKVPPLYLALHPISTLLNQSINHTTRYPSREHVLIGSRSRQGPKYTHMTHRFLMVDAHRAGALLYPNPYLHAPGAWYVSPLPM